ncbi:MAG: cbb3-type cytochrome c oxidase subunit II, partial [Flavobacteriales bacterium]
MSPGSIMPRYPWLFDNTINTNITQRKLEAMVTLGVPYSEAEVANAVSDLEKQAQAIYEDLKIDESSLLVGEEGLQPNHEIIALIAYLQRLGHDLEVENNKNAQLTQK